MEGNLVLEIEQKLSIAIFKSVQLIVNGQHGIRKVNVPDHVMVVYKASSTIMALKLTNKLDARNDLLNLTIGDLKLANKLVVAMEAMVITGEEDGAILAMEEVSLTIMDLKLANKLDARRDLL